MKNFDGSLIELTASDNYYFILRFARLLTFMRLILISVDLREILFVLINVIRVKDKLYRKDQFHQVRFDDLVAVH